MRHSNSMLTVSAGPAEMGVVGGVAVGVVGSIEMLVSSGDLVNFKYFLVSNLNKLDRISKFTEDKIY